MGNVTNATSLPSITIIAPCLFIAVTVCSSAGTVFDSLTAVHDVPPFLAAFWRLFVQNIIQFIPFVLSLRQAWRQDEEQRMMQHWTNDGGLALTLNIDDDENDNDDKDERRQNVSGLNQSTNSDDGLVLPKYIKSIPLLFLSGVALGSHFSFWVYSLRYTSITHSLLWVSMGPIVLNFGSWTLYLTGKILLALSFSSFSTMIAVKRPSWFETFGAVVGISGAIIMLLDIRSLESGSNSSPSNTSTIGQNYTNHPPSVHGDIAAFLGAVAVCFYLVIGNKLRSWLSIWLYVFPVIGFASLTCLIFALLDSKSPCTWTGLSNASVFGFISKDYFLYVLYLGVGPGILGHTMLSTLLKYISPLIVSTAMLFEPVMGSGIGYVFGLQPMPGLLTWIGGVVLLCGLILVIVGENEQHEDEAEEKESIASQEINYGSIK
mmetsp:Transcript_8042/g.12122  ORF Transcript_8042/g.12122 Transcript_8042/m.12122 type:complete len:433 (+) Transcript_8042:122-1420(+)|eukprot:CAMPEP_0203663622 /NCGR_PEP_ID=MMETSP0090-20130426/1195_1 /ASSEMBLY_ACC=CAM_ASM_001088 /TAXON_ID=426623 /ORGANISM="Chaetoceros affinis, Strain CCMP159" /LENGTH=432 /DNA_ID=CAMNT_0050526609 /DNA_START=92 /DNA_END=1390 /DNA_ORIENTATION=+